MTARGLLSDLAADAAPPCVLCGGRGGQHDAGCPVGGGQG